MGGGKWSDDAYTDRARVRHMTNTPVFAYDDDIKTGRTKAAVNPSIDPKLVAGAASSLAGQVTRESRDSVDHPESLAIGVMFDVTGSMGSVPRVLQTKLATLMNLLLVKGYVAHPQILFGAIGDAHTDTAPLQVGQFESDVTMEDHLAKIYLEGNGGGQTKESYELALYYFARHTAIDCFEKRGQKGYLFTMGDEGFYEVVKKKQVKEIIGDTLEADLKTVEVLKELQEKYHVFHIIIEDGGYPHNMGIEHQWKDLLGERCLLLEKSENVAELIALTIGLNEGVVDIDTGADHLRTAGVASGTVDNVTKALAPLAKTAVVKAGRASGLPDSSKGAGVTQL